MPRRIKGAPDFTHIVRSRGKLYCYFRKPGCKSVRLPLPIGSGEFWRAYEAALDASAPRSDIGASRSTPGSMAGLIAAFIGSNVSRQGKDGQPLGEETWRKRLAILNKLREKHGTKLVRGLRREHITGVILDGLPPHAKRNWVKVLRPLMAFAAANGWHADRDLMRDVKASGKAVVARRIPQGLPAMGRRGGVTGFLRARLAQGRMPQARRSWLHSAGDRGMVRAPLACDGAALHR
jgi:hypothetical protein